VQHDIFTASQQGLIPTPVTLQSTQKS